MAEISYFTIVKPYHIPIIFSLLFSCGYGQSLGQQRTITPEIRNAFSKMYYDSKRLRDGTWEAPFGLVDPTGEYYYSYLSFEPVLVPDELGMDLYLVQKVGRDRLENSQGTMLALFSEFPPDNTVEYFLVGINGENEVQLLSGDVFLHELRGRLRKNSPRTVAEVRLYYLLVSNIESRGEQDCCALFRAQSEFLDQYVWIWISERNLDQFVIWEEGNEE